MFRWGLEKLLFNSGDTVTIPPSGLVLIVGPNSAGKSVFLRNIHSRIQGSFIPVTVISDIKYYTEDSPEVAEWFSARYPTRNIGGAPHFLSRNGQLQVDSVSAVPGNPQQAWPFLVTLLDTETRLSVASQTTHIDPFEQPPQAYIHILLADDGLSKEISTEVEAAFGKQLMIDVASNQIGFRVGAAPPTDLQHDRLSTRYLEELKKLPRLQDEGDGIRSFVGAVLSARCGRQPVLLMDEPEAFLHPPQARRLGQALSRTAATEGRQVLAATHSADVVQGALDVAGADVMVVRVTREGDTNRAAVLAVDELKTLWSKPLLRSAAAIDGLFHRGVVVCEADADCRLYDAALRSLETRRQFSEAPDVYLAQGGGKGELATLAAAYRSVRVRTAVIADLDLLKNEAELSKLLKVFGADLEPYQGRYRSLVAALAGLPPTIPIDDFLLQVQRVMERVQGQSELRTIDRAELEALTRAAVSWSDAKRYGIDKLRGGQLTGAKELLADWQKLGLFLVPVGELEGWWPEGPSDNKADWIREALDRLSEGAVWADLDVFTKAVASYLGVVVKEPNEDLRRPSPSMSSNDLEAQRS